ncbi:MAG: hypothetical protein AABX88_03025, partial [Nanoarchaeota archaeon]
MKKTPKLLVFWTVGVLTLSNLFGCVVSRYNNYSSREGKIHEIHRNSQILGEHRKYATEINGSKVTVELHAGRCSKLIEKCSKVLEYSIEDDKKD